MPPQAAPPAPTPDLGEPPQAASSPEELRIYLDRNVVAEVNVGLIEFASLNSSAENTVIRPKKVRGTTSATSNAMVGMSAHQEDDLIVISFFRSIPRS